LQNRGYTAEREEDFGTCPRVGHDAGTYQHGCDANQSDEAALHAMRDLFLRHVAEENPLENVENSQRCPRQRCNKHQQLADDEGELPDLMGGSPDACQAAETDNDPEKGCRNDIKV
jgi:hypothetical protein